jgi:ABC-type lipopolysaccharide export system ATPase subunit
MPYQHARPAIESIHIVSVYNARNAIIVAPGERKRLEMAAMPFRLPRFPLKWVWLLAFA